jgi:hypothetical protein
VPEHKLAVFECAISDCKAIVSWYFNNENIETLENRKRFQALSVGEFRRLSIRNCLKKESGINVACKLSELSSIGKLNVTGNIKECLSEISFINLQN